MTASSRNRLLAVGVRDDLEEIALLEGDSSVHGPTEGHTRDLAGSYSMRIIRGELPSVIPDTEATRTTAGLELTTELGRPT